jgi:outer membrane protein assembly factor BamD (BamD/ComL family)
MKRTERHHLKDNELARMTASATHLVQERRTQLVWVGAAIVVVLAGVGGYFAWTSRTASRAHALLAEATAVDEASVGPLPAPGQPAPAGLRFETIRAKHQASLTKFKVVADEYPDTDAGIFARYREAATYMALGEPAKAAGSYQQVIDRAGADTFYGQLSRLGLAEAHAQTGQVEQAITTFKDLAQRKDGHVPVDGVLLRLGQACRDAGKAADAEQAFTRLVNEFPDSPFASDARRELEQLKKS